MKDVETLADEIVRREGGYVHDPDDPGGPTQHGVTLATLRRLGLDLDGDGAVTAGDVKRVDAATAREIFLEHYFRRPRIDALPRALWPTVFDMYVNAGAVAVRLLQRLVGDMGFPAAIDGVIGPRTIAAVEAAAEAAPDHIVDAYGIARRSYYYGLGDRRPSLRKFARRRDGGKGGWITRAEEFIHPRFHLSDIEHRRRVLEWG